MKQVSIALLVISLTASLIDLVRSSDDDPLLDLLKEAIEEQNEDMIKNHREYLTLPSVSGKVLGASISTGEGRIGKFSTLALRGDQQFFNQTDLDKLSIFNYDLLLGLDELTLHYEYRFEFLFIKVHGVVQVTTTNDSLRAIGSITSRDDGSCTAVLDSAKITELGKYHVSITPNNLPRTVERILSEFVANAILPHFLPAINLVLERIVKDVIPLTKFSEVVCKPFSL